MCANHRRGIPVPCGWPDCQTKIAFNSLSTHIRIVHGVDQGFGCDHCGLTNAQADVVQLHILEKHQSQDKVRPAAQALAQYYRTLYQKAYPETLGQIPKKDWTGRGSKSNKKSFHNCEKCGASISPATKAGYIKHLAQQHTIVIDLDHNRIKRQYAELLTNVVLSDETEIEEIDTSGADNLGLSHDYSVEDDFDDDLDDDLGNGLSNDLDDDDDISNSSHNEDDNVGINDRCMSGDRTRAVRSAVLDIGEHPTQSSERVVEQPSVPASSEVSISVPPLRRESAPTVDSQDLLRLFLDCVKESSLDKINEILTMYEVRSISGQQYRVHKDLPLDKVLNSDVIHATRLGNRWRCEVPQCGAILGECFITDLHLRAHGVTHLTEWYCMESTCFTDHARAFSDRQVLDAHIAEEHMNSSFALSAASRVPKQGVLMFGLSSHLKLKFAHNQSLVQESRIEWLDAESRLGQNDGSGVAGKSSTHDVRSCKKLIDIEVQENSRHESLELLLDSIDTDASSDSDVSDARRSESEHTFSKHCDGQWVSLSPIPNSRQKTSALRPRLAPGRCMVELPGGCFQVTEKRARRFIELYDQHRETLGHPTHQPVNIEATAVSDIATPEQADDLADSHNRHDKNTEGVAREFITVQYCPWPGCKHSITTDNTSMLVVHLMNRHLACFWQCREESCDYCYYVHPWDLTRHRMLCHIGSPLQCGHRNCDRVLVNDRFNLGRGHTSWSDLQNHFQTIFNQDLSNSSAQSVAFLNSETRSMNSSPSSRQQKSFLSPIEYLERFEHKSSSYLTPLHREQRSKQNRKLFQTSGISSPEVQVRGSHKCEGFFFDDQHFPCADGLDLTLETGLLIFVPGLCVFTIAQTCDYCVYTMSLISRPLASLPLPYHFGPKENDCTQRIGKGSEINDHAAFKDFCSREPLRIPPAAEEYAMLKSHNPRKIVIVDFEFVRRGVKNVPLTPTEVTVRDGNGDVIVSCVINEAGVTNADFVAKLEKLGYDNKSIRGVDRIRGPPDDRLPGNAKSAKQILKELTKAGLSPDCLWVEYSSSRCDWMCMQVLIQQAGRSIRSILPPKSKCWTVLPDFARCLPGLASYKLGRVLQLMDPHHESLSQLHWSGPDTAALYDLLENWIYVYGSR